jgi:hypothetical protein
VNNQNMESEIPSAGYVKEGFPAPGLRQIQRYITGHNSDGKGVFLSTDSGDHHRIMFDGRAVSNILYSTQESPTELNGDADVQKAKEREVSDQFSYLLIPYYHCRITELLMRDTIAAAALS